VLSTSPDSAAGVEGPEAVLIALYDVAASSSGSGSTSGIPDYSGYVNYPTFLKWQELSRTAEASSRILNLNWTDLAANYMMGSTIRSSTGQAAAGSSRQSEVRTFSHRITYDLRYAIPAFVFLLVYTAVVLSGLVLWIVRRAKFTYLKSLLNQTATGRAVTANRAGDQTRTLSTKKWIQAHGSADIGIRKHVRGGAQYTAMAPNKVCGDEDTVDSRLIREQQGGPFHAIIGDKNDLAPHVPEMRRSS
jgi:hypothetical protein